MQRKCSFVLLALPAVAAGRPASAAGRAEPPAVVLPSEELRDVLPGPADTGFLFPARGLAAFVAPGDAFFPVLKLRTALTPPPGIQQERALFGWEAALVGRGGLRVQGAPPQRYPVRVAQIRPAGPTLTYRFRLEVPAWVPADVYDLEVWGPGFRGAASARVRVTDPARPRPLVAYACGREATIPAAPWAALDVEAVALTLDRCPEAALDPASLPETALVVAHPPAIARDLFRMFVGPTRYSFTLGGRRFTAADADGDFERAERARATANLFVALPFADVPEGRAALVPTGAQPSAAGRLGPPWDPAALRMELAALEVRTRAPEGIPLRFKVVTDGAAWAVVGPDGPVEPTEVATAGPPTTPGVREAAVLYFSVAGCGRDVTYRASRHDLRPPVAALFVDGVRAGAAPRPARVGERVSLEVRSDEAAAVVWDLGAETGGSATGPRAALTYRHIGRHEVSAVVLGKRGNRRVIRTEFVVAPGGGPSCTAGPPGPGAAAPDWTGAACLAIMLAAARFPVRRRGNTGRGRQRSDRIP